MRSNHVYNVIAAGLGLTVFAAAALLLNWSSTFDSCVSADDKIVFRPAHEIKETCTYRTCIKIFYVGLPAETTSVMYVEMAV